MDVSSSNIHSPNALIIHSAIWNGAHPTVQFMYISENIQEYLSWHLKDPRLLSNTSLGYCSSGGLLLLSSLLCEEGPFSRPFFPPS